jgi:hypothetical protein
MKIRLAVVLLLITVIGCDKGPKTVNVNLNGRLSTRVINHGKEAIRNDGSVSVKDTSAAPATTVITPPPAANRAIKVETRGNYVNISYFYMGDAPTFIISTDIDGGGAPAGTQATIQAAPGDRGQWVTLAIPYSPTYYITIVGPNGNLYDQVLPGPSAVLNGISARAGSLQETYYHNNNAVPVHYCVFMIQDDAVINN